MSVSAEAGWLLIETTTSPDLRPICSAFDPLTTRLMRVPLPRMPKSGDRRAGVVFASEADDAADRAGPRRSMTSQWARLGMFGGPLSQLTASGNGTRG